MADSDSLKEWEKRKAEKATREKVLEEAQEEIASLCSGFNDRHGEKGETVGGRAFRWQAGIYMVPIKDGDVGVIALNGKTESLRKEFDFGAACDILNEVGCIGFHQGYGKGVELIENPYGGSDARRLVMRDGRPALIDGREREEWEHVWRDDGKSPWDCSTYTVEDVGNSKRIECDGGCRRSEVVKWRTMGFGGREAVLGILREWMEPERRADSQRIRIVTVVHQFEQEHVLAGFIRNIKVGMGKVTMTIETERLIPTGIYYG